MPKKKTLPKTKPGLHPKSKHRKRYDFNQLTATLPELAAFVKPNNYGDESIDFFDPQAVKVLNKALLQHHYEIKNWDIPKNYLCPPIPGRADYIHHIADLLNHKKRSPKDKPVKCLDVGVGASCIYPIIGIQEYGWSFVGSDIDPVAIASATQIMESNPPLHGKLELRLQSNPEAIFQGIIQKGESFDLTICNPPFHTSEEKAREATLRKLKNLKGKKTKTPVLKFGGQNNELWCEGGEAKFVENMIFESKQFADSCGWFSTLISRESNLNKALKFLKKAETAEVKIIPMAQGNKTSRILAWTFLSQAQQKK